MKLRITTQSEVKEYYGHGKLLITGEYFVLDGALALAVPTRLGQRLRVKELHSTEGTLYWVSLNNQGKVWLNLVFDTADFSCINDKSPEAGRLSKILTEARKLNPAFLTDKRDLAIETRLEFPNQWGLGSSSTLIHCVATWAGVNGYELLQQTIGGSGYDVACAGIHTPILYKLINGMPEVIKANWKPAFYQNIYFAYTGKKQLSTEGISYYRSNLKDKTQVVNDLTRITQLLLQAETLQSFEALLNEHETIVGGQLKMMKAKDTLFADFSGTVKSLGAWGGDFVLLTYTGEVAELRTYLQQKGIDTVFSWEELILPS
ncbi:MAG: GYDIA family GHMP kinase [Chitinophagales bacterium]